MSYNRQSLIKDNCKCSCKGNNLDKFIQPNILSILSAHELHGYIIIQKLQEKNFFKNVSLDSTGIYRTLKTLEAKGMVESDWNIEGTGAAKKIYKITPKGRECMDFWLITLEQYHKDVGYMLEDLRDSLKHT